MQQFFCMQKCIYAINLSCQCFGYHIQPTSLSPVKDIQHFIQLDIFLDKKLDIVLLCNYFPTCFQHWRFSVELNYNGVSPSGLIIRMGTK